MSNEHELEQPKLRVLERLTVRNGHHTKDTQHDIIEELIQVETYEIVLKESISQPEELNQMMESNQTENVQPDNSWNCTKSS